MVTAALVSEQLVAGRVNVHVSAPAAPLTRNVNARYEELRECHAAAVSEFERAVQAAGEVEVDTEAALVAAQHP